MRSVQCAAVVELSRKSLNPTAFGGWMRLDFRGSRLSANEDLI